MAAACLTADEFVAAFARHGRALWVLAAAWVGRGDADDLVQETARIAWGRRHQFTGGDLAAWLAQIARHTGANWRRRRQPVPADPSQLTESGARAETMPSWSFARVRDDLPDELAQALAAVPEPARACLLLHAVADLTFPEIAAMLELNENTASSHVRRARLQLRAALQRPAPMPSAIPTPLPETP